MLSFLLALSLLSEPLAPPRPVPVYICQGSASYAYHASARCEGLAWCSTSAKAVSKAAAVKLGRRPCGRCTK